MSQQLAVRSFQSLPLMGRKRTVNKGLPIHMAKKGDCYYYVSNNPRRWIPLGKELGKAKRMWAEEESRGAPVGLTVGEVVQRHADRGERPAATLKQYESYQRTLAQAFAVSAGALNSQAVAVWRERPEQRCRPHYVNGCIAVLEAAFKLGHEQGACEILTVGKLPTERRSRYLEDAEYVAIREKAVPWLKVAMGLGYLTASRPSDIRSLQWAQVGKELTLRQHKTGQRIAFAMTAELVGVFEEARKRRVLGLYVVADGRGRQISPSTFGRAWRAACEAAKVDAQFRDIRAKSGTDAKSGGQNYQALLGHANPAMSERYIKRREVVMADPVRRKL